MAVALCQQGISDFDTPRLFNFKDEFENYFSVSKENDTNVSTTAGKDIIIIQGIKMYVRWLMFWSMYREGDSANDPKWNDPDQ